MNKTIFSDLQAHGGKPCMIAEGQRLSFSEVAQAADRLYDRPDMPQAGLAFVMATNSIDGILAYIGAVRRGLAVHLLDPSKTEANQRLIALYAPDVIVDPRQADAVQVHGTGLGVHPDISILLSTSGSTGAAKFVKLSHRNISANTHAIIEYLGLAETDCGITSLKFFYSYGMSVVNIHLCAGAALVVTDLSTDDPAFWDLVAREEVSNIAGVPFTFELMHQARTDLGTFPRLRLLTQAGGKLSPDLVRHFAEDGARHGIDFHVMYGQTEASPRMSHLPPDRAASAPGSIGKAIPGGSLYLVTDTGDRITQPDVSGELVYEGPNVMVGYAETRADLARVETIPALHTGDIAHVDAQGLFYIDGRSSRFVKPFGMRVSLDEIERVLRDRHTVVAATGTDERIIIAIEDALPAGTETVTSLALQFGLPPATFIVVSDRPVPRLASGKPDYKGLVAEHLAPAPEPSLAKVFIQEFWGALSGRAQPPSSAHEAFRVVLGDRIQDRDMTFRRAGGDSLTYMQLYLMLEEYMGEVPEDWAEMTIAELEHVKGARFV